MIWHLLVSHPALNEPALESGEQVGSRDEASVIVGGAGFIGSHFVDRLLADAATARGHPLRQLLVGPRMALRAPSRRRPAARRARRRRRRSTRCAQRCTVTTSSSTWRRTPTSPARRREPTIDFDEGTALTHNVVEAMRTTSVEADPLRVGQRRVRRPRRASRPTRTTGRWCRRRPTAPASSRARRCIVALRGDVRISAAARSASATSSGPRQTHGVGFDFVAPLCVASRERRCAILGDGTQSKSYIHVDDVVERC